MFLSGELEQWLTEPSKVGITCTRRFITPVEGDNAHAEHLIIVRKRMSDKFSWLDYETEMSEGK